MYDVSVHEQYLHEKGAALAILHLPHDSCASIHVSCVLLAFCLVKASQHPVLQLAAVMLHLILGILDGTLLATEADYVSISAQNLLSACSASNVLTLIAHFSIG